jgi:hypothetical protein
MQRTRRIGFVDDDVLNALKHRQTSTGHVWRDDRHDHLAGSLGEADLLVDVPGVVAGHGQQHDHDVAALYGLRDLVVHVAACLDVVFGGVDDHADSREPRLDLFDKLMIRRGMAQEQLYVCSCKRWGRQEPWLAAYLSYLSV